MKTARDWLRSFRYAYEGVKYAFATQRNMRFHFFAALLVLLTAIIVGLGKTEILFLLLGVTLVVISELINTAIEKTVDLAMPSVHPIAKIAKDVAAAAVLVASVFAASVGFIVFFDPISRLMTRIHTEKPLTAGSVFIYLALVCLSVMVLQTRFTLSRLPRPSLWTAISFSVSAMIGLSSRDPLVTMLGLGLAALLSILLYERGGRRPEGLLFGAMLGVAITTLAYYLSHT